MAKEPREKDEQALDNLLNSLESLNFDQLVKVEEKVQQLIQDRRIEAKHTFLEEIRLKAQALGLKVVDSSQDMTSYTPTRRATLTGSKTFLYGDEHGNKWTGKGPRPRWFKEALEAGKTIEDLKLPQH